MAQKTVLSEIKKEDERVRNRESEKTSAKEQTKCCLNRSAKPFKSPQSLGKKEVV